MKTPSKHSVLIIVGIALIVCTSSLALYFYVHARNLEKQPSTAQKNEQIQQTITAVSKLMVLPAGEQPTVVTVSDPEKLKSQAFFALAQAGDKMLVFQGAKKAILYRPSENKIIEMSSITMSDTPAATQTEGQDISVVLYNGTTIVGITKKYETEIKKIVPDITVIDRDNAKKKTYEKSILVDMTGKKGDIATTLAQKLNLTLSDLPVDEATSGGLYDFLIIVGVDKK